MNARGCESAISRPHALHRVLLSLPRMLLSHPCQPLTFSLRDALRYICPLTKKALSNVNPASVLRPSGMVVSTACIKDFIKKEMRDPFTDPPAKLKEKDIIALRVEGTGFAARTDDSAINVSKTKVGGGGGW